jgi:5-methylcytosine-specific restriction endonuclease McrA
MMEQGQELLEELRNIRHLASNKFRKRKNESDRDFVIRKAGQRCAYCRNHFPKTKLSVVKKDPSKDYLPMIKNGVCACRDCANKKQSMTDYEFRSLFVEMKKEVRQEVFENYHQIRKQVFKKYNHTCIYCLHEYGRMPEGRKLTIDHKIPVAKGGTNDLNNLACACQDHNSDKRDLTTEEYFKRIEKRKQMGNLL